ncbi:MAG: hypothetical protein KKD73_00370 [Proteobacteria bacterium]|nr:hypothetical protein [Pseudomonadota bacterium]MBU1639135.1 hypothetical protein [Pseudomonadota bacterium]
MSSWQRPHWQQILIVADYYLAALLLLIASLVKLWTTPEPNELLQALYELNFLPFSAVLFLERWQAPLELLLACAALYGWQAEKLAWLLATLYLLFTGALALASQGYLLLPIDCGCFGNSNGGNPALLLITRNALIALPLLFAKGSIRSLTLHSFLRKHC